jgi:hypothetical protein
MPTATPIDCPTHGKIIAVFDDGVVFAPSGTSYELRLKTDSHYAGAVNTPVEVLIRATARKVWTVPSGGNFISPIIGPPKIIQGRVTYADEKQLVVRAGAMFLIDLPSAEHAVDLPNGPIAVGHMVNVTAFAGATIEIVARHAPSASPGVAHVGTPGDAPEAVG